MILRNQDPDFLEEVKEEMSAGDAVVFCQNLGISIYFKLFWF